MGNKHINALQITYKGKHVISDKEDMARWIKRFPRVSADLLDILLSCLCWNPHERPTAEALLEHHAFTSVRNKPLLTVLVRARLEEPRFTLAIYNIQRDKDWRAILRKLIDQLE